MKEQESVSVRWRGVPPEGQSFESPFRPLWTQSLGFTAERARECLTSHYGADWTLEEQAVYKTVRKTSWYAVNPS